MSRSLRVLTGAVAAAIGGVAAALYAMGRPRPPVPPERRRPPVPPPALPPARTVAVPGRGEIFLRDAAGPPDSDLVIVLLHGWIYPADVNWFSCFEPLSRIGRVLAPDHRGHGRGLRSPDPFRLVDAADDVAGLLRELSTPPVIAVGYSMGGTVAQLLWRRHPELVQGMVLCATSDSWALTRRNRWVWRLMGPFQVLMRALPRHRIDWLAHMQAEGRLPVRVSRMLPQRVPPEIKALVPWMVGEFQRDSAEDIAEAGREMGRYDARGWIGEIDVPAAVVLTARDWMVPPGHQRAMASRLADAAVYELDLDHNAVLARPDLFVPALIKAVREVSGRARTPGDS